MYIQQEPQKENGEKGAKGIFEITAAENFLNLKTGTYQQIQEAQRKRNMINIYIYKIDTQPCHSQAS